MPRKGTRNPLKQRSKKTPLQGPKHTTTQLHGSVSPLDSLTPVTFSPSRTRDCASAKTTFACERSTNLFVNSAGVTWAVLESMDLIECCLPSTHGNTFASPALPRPPQESSYVSNLLNPTSSRSTANFSCKSYPFSCSSFKKPFQCKRTQQKQTKQSYNRIITAPTPCKKPSSLSACMRSNALSLHNRHTFQSMVNIQIIGRRSSNDPTSKNYNLRRITHSRGDTLSSESFFFLPFLL